MVAKQLSIFLENKSGRLTEVTEVLAKEGVNLSALCIAENADFGILRGIVSEPDKAYKESVAPISRVHWQKFSAACPMKVCLLNICTLLPMGRPPMSLSVLTIWKTVFAY